MSLTSEQQKAIEHHSREIAKILNAEADSEAIKTLEGIERTVRAQILEHVSPTIGVFLSKPKQERPKAENAPSKASLANSPYGSSKPND